MASSVLESCDPKAIIEEAMVDLVQQLREGVEKKYSRESLEVMLIWAADEIERLREHKRLQAEDIMTLGQEVGRLSAGQTLREP